MLPILLLLLMHSLALASAKRTPRESSKSSSDKVVVYPSSGFFRAKDEAGSGVAVKVTSSYRQQLFCERIKFINMPVPNKSPFVNGEYFDFLPEESFHGKFTYYNGNEYLSFIQGEGGDDSKGTWLVGNEPGIDSGYVYLKPTELSVSPLGLESKTLKWHWLQESKWVAQEHTKVICAEDENEGGRNDDNDNNSNSNTDDSSANKSRELSTFYSVEYMKSGVSESIRGTLFPISKSLVELNFAKYFSIPENVDLNDFDAVIINSDDDSWEPLKNSKDLVSVGDPFLISSRANSNSNDVDGKIAYLVSDEMSGSSGWRLTFRYLFDTAETSRDGINVIGTSDNLIPDYYDTSPLDRTMKIKALMEHRQNDESIIEYDSNGFKDLRVQNLNKKLSSTYITKSTNTIENAKVGEYIWIWFSSKPDESTSASSVDQLLLQCVLSTESIVMFEFFESNRLDTMRRTVLDGDTQYAIYHRSNSSSSSSSSNSNSNKLEINIRNKAFNVHSAMSLGSNVVNFLLSYLYHKDSALGGISSCYLYHGAVSLPRALVYAAEIVCVLLGAKPVTMIQYTTPTDHQWKFPLVRELVKSISQAKAVFGDKIDIDFETFTYGKDESLVIYRTSSRYIAHSLQPLKQAQALHPAPYPDSEGRPKELTNDWKLQIFYAWWNGYMLGYPENFVDSYCQTFHNGLNTEDKELEINRAKQSVKEYFRELWRYDKNFKRCHDIKNDIESCSLEIKASGADEMSKNIKSVVEDGYRYMASNPNLSVKFDHHFIGFDIGLGPLDGDFWKFINY